jgi:hypothetical protein
MANRQKSPLQKEMRECGRDAGEGAEELFVRRSLQGLESNAPKRRREVDQACEIVPGLKANSVLQIRVGREAV